MNKDFNFGWRLVIAFNVQTYSVYRFGDTIKLYLFHIKKKRIG